MCDVPQTQFTGVGVGVVPPPPLLPHDDHPELHPPELPPELPHDEPQLEPHVLHPVDHPELPHDDPPVVQVLVVDPVLVDGGLVMPELVVVGIVVQVLVGVFPEEVLTSRTFGGTLLPMVTRRIYFCSPMAFLVRASIWIS